MIQLRLKILDRFCKQLAKCDELYNSEEVKIFMCSYEARKSLDSVADENIMKLVEGMKVPFFRYNIDLNKFRELQSAFLKSGVKNVEIPTDAVLMAVSYELANRYGIKTILSGGNVATESIMPPSWGHNARDLTHIKAIYKKFIGKKLSGLPMCSIWKWNFYRWIKKIKIMYLLD